MLPVARTRAINLIADEALTANRAAAPRIELPLSTAAMMRSRKSRDNGAGMTSPQPIRTDSLESAFPIQRNRKML